MGDVEHFPLTHAQVLAKIERLVDSEDAARIDRVVADVLHSADAVRTVSTLPLSRAVRQKPTTL